MGTHKHCGATCKCASSLFLSLGMIQQWLTQFNGISQRSTRANPLNDLYRQPPGRQAVGSTAWNFYLISEYQMHYVDSKPVSVTISFVVLFWTPSRHLKSLFQAATKYIQILGSLSHFLAKQPENAQKGPASEINRLQVRLWH